MGNQSVNSFGVFSGSSGGGGGGGTVTSIAAGTGIVCTPDPITATGSVALDNVNGLVSTFDGGQGPLSNITGAVGNLSIYDPTTFPSTTFTMVQKGRAFFSISDAGANERLGVGGVGTHDLISISATITTTCGTGGLFIGAIAGNGILAQTFTPDVASITCNGTAQSQVFTTPDFRAGNNTQGPTDPSIDYIQGSFVIGGVASGQVSFTDITINITQFSD